MDKKPTYEELTQKVEELEILLDSEKRYRRFVENIKVEYFFYSHDVEGNFHYISPSVSSILGYPPEDFQAHYSKFLTDSPINKKVHTHTAQSIKGVQQPIYEAEVYNQNGDTRFLEILDIPIYDNQGKVIAVEGIAHDVTERKRSENRIKASLKEKELLLREIHHRVKNNLQVIISLLELQSAKFKNKQSADLFKGSRDRIKAMAIVHNKLHQSKDFTKIDFSGYTKDIVNNLFQSYDFNNDRIKLTVNVNGVSLGLDASIPCGLIINELVTNSLKYAFPKDRNGEIEITLLPMGGKGIELCISDDGIGLPDGLNLKNTDTMGLKIVTVLAEKQLRGKIDLDTSKGTAIRIIFSSHP